MRKLLCILLCIPCLLKAQLPSEWATAGLATETFPSYFRSPLDIEILLSGNFGEFRPNHFHAGYDFRTQGAVGAKLYAVAEGYISRVSVSPSGYGNALYIVHPNGTTTLYGHLLDFAKEIQDYVVEKQYEAKSFSVDLPLSDTLFPVKKGDLIGRTGNSGSSGGPHLHFEVRHTESQTPLNYSAYGLFPVSDNSPPRLTRLQFYSYSKQAGVARSRLLRSANISRPTERNMVSDTFYVAIGAYDKMDNSNGLLALARYEVYLDGEKQFTYTKSECAPARSRYVNSVIQYSQFYDYRRGLLKTYVEPGNLLRHHFEAPTGGLFALQDSLDHTLRIVLTDDYGNQSEHHFVVAKRTKAKPVRDSLQGKTLLWALPNYVETPGCELFLPMGALAKNVDFVLTQAASIGKRDSLLFAPIWQVHDPLEPLMRPVRLRIDASGVPQELRSKALIVSIQKDGGLSGLGGRWQGDFLEAQTSQFGRYSVAIDTVPPRIRPLFNEKTNMRGVSLLRFGIGDNLSGIASYEGYIDGEWVLFSYDAKYGTISYVFDRKRITRGKKHALELRVTDNRQNQRIYTTSFEW
jgi:Membrane proteins related to metalloendopeptidases